MDFSQLSNEIIEKCSEVLKDAWKPVEAIEVSNDNKTVTKFGGADPFRSSKFEWPKCAECNRQKAFICQINLAELPSKFKLKIQRCDGLFQCFFCLQCMPFDGCFDDIYFLPQSELIPSLQSLVSKSVFQNHISTTRLPDTLKSSISLHNEVYRRWDWEGFEEKHVQQWIELKNEMPSYEEITQEEEHTILASTNVSEDDLMDMMEEEDDGFMSFPSSGVKLGGYVRWCQGVEYPTCPDCKVKMTITFLQLEESTLFPFNWGDSGTAHITLCQQCGRPGLGWACC